jgi:hypothetical protein
MATSYMTPGVYVEEVPAGPRPIGGVGTSTAAFVGEAPDGNAHLNEAVPCNNWSQFVKAFVPEKGKGTDLARAVFGFFMNGGTRCYVVNVGPGGSVAGDARKRTGLGCLEPIDEVAIVAAPGHHDAASHDALLSFCERMGDRVAILDPPPTVDDIDALKTVATLSAESPAETEKGGKGAGALRPRSSDGGYGAFYFPWLTVRDPFDAGAMVAVPPSGHIAGIYARVDATRGVHKAPANEVIRGALGLAYQVTWSEQGELNRKGVNCLRVVANAIRVWGARTLAEEASEWRYVNVRRLINFIKESIEEGTNWTVFEPNDVTLRQSVVRDVSNFLQLQWRAGALVGATPGQAFFVKCDAENNPPEVVDAGRLIVDIGVAPSKPAEFIIFRIAQWAGAAGGEGGAAA